MQDLKPYRAKLFFDLLFVCFCWRKFFLENFKKGFYLFIVFNFCFCCFLFCFGFFVVGFIYYFSFLFLFLFSENKKNG